MDRPRRRGDRHVLQPRDQPANEQEDASVMTTVTPVDTIPALDKREAAALAAGENGRFVELVRSLHGADWTKPTDCPEWDVRAMTSHVLGAMEANDSLRVFVHQFRAGKKAAGDRPDIDG